MRCLGLPSAIRYKTQAPLDMRMAHTSQCGKVNIQIRVVEIDEKTD